MYMILGSTAGGSSHFVPHQHSLRQARQWRASVIRRSDDHPQPFHTGLPGCGHPRMGSSQGLPPTRGSGTTKSIPPNPSALDDCHLVPFPASTREAFAVQHVGRLGESLFHQRHNSKTFSSSSSYQHMNNNNNMPPALPPHSHFTVITSAP